MSVSDFFLPKIQNILKGKKKAKEEKISRTAAVSGYLATMDLHVMPVLLSRVTTFCGRYYNVSLGVKLWLIPAGSNLDPSVLASVNVHPI